MAKLSDALAALLKDIALSRMQSDLFSKAASEEYSHDPVLKLFPVPRVEIRSLDLELAFAVADAKQKEVNISETVRPLLLQSGPELRRQIFNIPAPTPSRARSNRTASSTVSTDTLLTLLNNKRAQVESDFDKRFESFVSQNNQGLSEQILRDREKFNATVSAAAGRIMRETFTANQIGIKVGTQLQKDLRDRVAAWSKIVGVAVKTAADRAAADAFSIDIAITKDDLANVSANAVSRVKLSVEMRNIELIQTEDENGQTVNKPIIS